MTTTNDEQAPDIPAHWWTVPFVAPTRRTRGRMYHEDHQFLKMNTSDKPTEQAPYGERPMCVVYDKDKTTVYNAPITTERAPLLSDGKLCFPPRMSPLEVRDLYENLIDKGELRVVKKAEVWHPSVPEEVWRKWLNDDHMSLLVTKCCSRNPYLNTNRHFFGVPYLKWVCPGCGAQITNPTSQE